MTYPQLDRFRVQMKPLAERQNRRHIERDHIDPAHPPQPFPAEAQAILDQTLARIRRARADNRPVILAFGAHAIKNGLAPVLIQLMERGWLTHLATNGAAVIHDWEFAFQGKTSEDVRAGVAQGEFGNWQETGFYINLALNVGAYQGRGYGEAVGAFIQHEGLGIPSRGDLEQEIAAAARENPEQAAAAADLLWAVKTFDLAGPVKAPHPWKEYSVQAAAFRLGVPFTSHPMFGHDIIYNHPMSHGGSIGRVAERDFLRFAAGVSELQGGVYLSVGSAVMSPMIFEKSLSMAQNLARQAGKRIDDLFIVVVDLAASAWDWSRGEPPEESPDYYLRFCKTFHRMGGQLQYLRADNRDFLLALAQGLGRPT